MDCPYCGTGVEIDTVDTEAGELQIGPGRCPGCEAEQIGPFETIDEGELDADEQRCWWRKGPDSPALPERDV